MKLFKALIRRKKSKESYFKYIIVHLHLWLGLLAGIVICATSLSGATYVFKEEVIKWADRDHVYRIAPSVKEASIDTMVLNFEAAFDVLPSRVTLPQSKSENVLLTARQGRTSTLAYFDRTTGELLGSDSEGTRAFFSWTLRLHRWLLMREGGGKQINAWSTFFFLFLLISGIVLWFPLKKSKIKPAFVIKWKAKSTRLNYDLHNVFGFYSSLALLLVVITGLCFSFGWWRQGVLGVFKSKDEIASDAQKQDIQEKALDEMDALFAAFLEEEEEIVKISYDSIVNIAEKELPYPSQISIILPSERNPHLTIRKVNNHNWLGIQLTDEVTFNEKGELLEVSLFEDKALFQKVNKLILPLHTGDFAGVKSKIIYFLLAIISASLPITGFFIWWNKTKKKIGTVKNRRFKNKKIKTQRISNSN